MSDFQEINSLKLTIGEDESAAPRLWRRLIPFDPHLIRNLLRLTQSLYLLYGLTWRGIRGRYRQSLLGIGWAILTPAAMTAVFTYVILRTGLTRNVAYPCPLPLYALCLLSFWNYFSRAVTNGSTSLVSNMDLVTKVYFPREVLPISSVLTNLVDWVISFLMFVIVAAGYTYIYPESATHFPQAYPFLPHVRWLWIPVFLLLITLFTLGLVFFAATMQVYFRDVAHLINLSLFLWLFVTPVLYPLRTLAGGRVSTFVIFNPMTGLIDGIQLCVFAHKFPWERHVVYAAAMAVCFFIVGYCFFKHEERYFADVV